MGKVQEKSQPKPRRAKNVKTRSWTRHFTWARVTWTLVISFLLYAMLPPEYQSSLHSVLSGKAFDFRFFDSKPQSKKRGTTSGSGAKSPQKDRQTYGGQSYSERLKAEKRLKKES